MSPRNYHAKFSGHSNDSWWHFSGGPLHYHNNNNKKIKTNKLKLFLLKIRNNYNKTSEFK